MKTKKYIFNYDLTRKSGDPNIHNMLLSQNGKECTARDWEDNTMRVTFSNDMECTILKHELYEVK